MSDTLPPRDERTGSCADTPGVDCRAAMQQLWDFLDSELTDERMAAVRMHLQSCRGCLPHHDFARTFLETLAATRGSPEGCCPPRVRAKVLEKLRREGYCGKA